MIPVALNSLSARLSAGETSPRWTSGRETTFDVTQTFRFDIRAPSLKICTLNIGASANS